MRKKQTDYWAVDKKCSSLVFYYKADFKVIVQRCWILMTPHCAPDSNLVGDIHTGGEEKQEVNGEEDGKETKEGKRGRSIE